MSEVANSCKNSNAESHLESKTSGDVDVIVVGAGVAGSALAHTLGKDGRKVRVIERNLHEPNRIVGELLQPAGYLRLRELGLHDCVREIDAQCVLGYVIYKDGKSVRVPYPLENYDSDVAARCFHHGRFVQRMREKAASLPNVMLVQGTATSLIEERGIIKGVRYKTSASQELTAYAPLTVICDGCFSSFREFLTKPKITKLSHFAGFIIENCELPLQYHAHLIAAYPSAFVFYPISSTEVRFLMDFPGAKIPSIANGEMADFLKTKVAPQVPVEIYSAFMSSVDKAEIKTMPISCMPASPCLAPGAILLGDALNMRHALAAGGMTVALHDIVTVCNLFRHLNLQDTETVSKYTQHFYNIRKPMAFTMNVMADSVYKLIISSPDEIRKEIQEACFKYLFRRSDYSRVPMELFSGLNPHPWRLLLFSIATAIYIVGGMLLPFPSARRVRTTARVAWGATQIIIPILLKEGVVQALFATKASYRSPPKFT